METVDATQPTVAMEPVGASRPAVAVDPAAGTQPVPGGGALPASPGDQSAGGGETGTPGGDTGTEPCAHCGAPLARDQRYCLECGTPRTYLSGMLLERLRSPGGQAQPGVAGQPTAALLSGPAPYAANGASSAWPRNNVLTLIAGIGVLLLAMGVGVLIGRSGSSTAGNTPAPQVITVGGGNGAASTPTTPTTTEAAPAVKGGAAGAAAAKQKAKATESSSGVGATPSKPAPPSVLKNLRKKGSGESYEQKSKNLPNVVETG